jgi:hypothetical protein
MFPTSKLSLHKICQRTNFKFGVLRKTLTFEQNEVLYPKKRTQFMFQSAKYEIKSAKRLMFSKIELIVQSDVLTVKYEGSGADSEESWQFTGIEKFKLFKNQLKVIDSKNEVSKSSE